MSRMINTRNNTLFHAQPDHQGSLLASLALTFWRWNCEMNRLFFLLLFASNLAACKSALPVEPAQPSASPTQTLPTATQTPILATATPTPSATPQNSITPTTTRSQITPSRSTPSRTPTTAGATTTLTTIGACPQGCTTPPPGCLIKGNISSSGEKIYHVPGGAFYAQTIIDPTKGERWFCTEAEALTNGWRKSLR